MCRGAGEARGAMGGGEKGSRGSTAGGPLSSVGNCGGGHTGPDLIKRIVWELSGSEPPSCHLPSCHRRQRKENSGLLTCLSVFQVTRFTIRVREINAHTHRYTHTNTEQFGRKHF